MVCADAFDIQFADCFRPSLNEVADLKFGEVVGLLTLFVAIRSFLSLLVNADKGMLPEIQRGVVTALSQFRRLLEHVACT